MKRFLVILALVIAGVVSASYDEASAGTGYTTFGGRVLGSDANIGVFCSIESAEVCVLTQDEADCKKLEGKKVDSCPASQTEE